MNRNKLKTYAPHARRDFIQAVTHRATQYGLMANKIEPMTEQGEVVLIAGQPFPKSVGAKRKKLEARIQKLGFEQTMEAMAYTWFNRLVAIRFMELHEYLEHGFRVLSHPEGHPQPEILEHAQHVDLPGLDQKTVVELKLDGTKEEELYRLLLIAQCNALHKALPFLFESIDDEAELLLPDRLLHSDSLIRNLVMEIPEEDWQEVEIIGWLYQFYISDKNDEVIGKVVASEDIPAATQLFTPNWIVKYLVQNTLGRQWLATYPNSPLKGQMEYYIEPAEQTPEVQEQLKAITPTSLDPEELTLLDPACGSGHILVEAYELFKAIYEERGRRPKDIPALILTKNLFGLEIDDRAAQLAAFALMMKARADDRRIFDSEAKPNIVAIQDSRGLDAAAITHALNSPINKEDVPKESLFEEIDEKNRGLFSKVALAEKGHVSQADIAELLELFENGKTFGSLIQIPPTLAAKLPEIEKRLDDVLKFGDLMHTAAHVLKPLLQQTRLLARQYNAVVMNPPYLSSGSMNEDLKEFVTRTFSAVKGDLFAVFVERAYGIANSSSGFIGAMTPFTWMYIKTYEAMRERLLSDKCLWSLVKPEYHAFFESAYVPICSFTVQNVPLRVSATFIDLSEFYGESMQPTKTLEAVNDSACKWRFRISTEELSKIPGSPIAFSVSPQMRLAFSKFDNCSGIFFSDGLTKTGNNERYLRMCWEVAYTDAKDPCRYRTCAKGGDARRYYGNCDVLVDWSESARRHYREDHVARITPEYLWQHPGITWTKISSKGATFRLLEPGAIAETGGPTIFTDAGENQLLCLLAFLNSPIAEKLLALINPTLNVQTADVLKLPFHIDDERLVVAEAKRAIELSREDWNASETSLDFVRSPLLASSETLLSLDRCWTKWCNECEFRLGEMSQIEKRKNSAFIASFGLADELSSQLPVEEITLSRPDREEDIKRLLSYAIGCMMGRYSLDKLGLIYAHGGNQGFDHDQYRTFPADDDGILPLTEFGWFDDDVAHRFETFLATAWPAEDFDENLQFVADSLGPKKGESPRETIRRYLAADFFKHHLSMYKRRPIYWLFSSGKQRGFQALVYLHRYNEGTLARMRTEYVIPLLGKMTARINHLTDDIAAATSSQHRKRLETEKATVTKQLAEVQAFDEKLRHCADQRIKLDLDDGVKVNYGKFGDLLADVKAVCGTKDDE